MKGLSHTEDRPNTGPVPMAAQSASPAVTATYGFSRILEMPPNTRIFSPLVLVEQGAHRLSVLSAVFTIAVRRWFSIKASFLREAERE